MSPTLAQATSKVVSEDDVVAELRDGMTIGIGGWGSRRKPMSLVRAIARSDVKDLTVVSYGGPDLGLLCATGKSAPEMLEALQQRLGQPDEVRTAAEEQAKILRLRIGKFLDVDPGLGGAK